MNLDINEVKKQSKTYYGMTPKKLKDLREQAKYAIRKAQSRHLERINLNAKSPSYKIGDLVLIRKQTRSSYVERKWSVKYKGPYKIKRIISPVVYLVQNITDRNDKDLVHAVYMRPYKKRTHSPIPDVKTESDDDESGSEDDAEVNPHEKYIQLEPTEVMPKPDNQQSKDPSTRSTNKNSLLSGIKRLLNRSDPAVHDNNDLSEYEQSSPDSDSEDEFASPESSDSEAADKFDARSNVPLPSPNIDLTDPADEVDNQRRSSRRRGPTVDYNISNQFRNMMGWGTGSSGRPKKKE
jgi:hypothetical protein